MKASNIFRHISAKYIFVITALLTISSTAYAVQNKETLNSDNTSDSLDCRRNFKMGVKTNMLYDAALIPNIGVDISLGKRWSIAGNWMYAWWKNDRKHNYWRTYGGDIEMRYWFGSKNRKEQLAGHHIGLYGQMITYDFELGGRGYLGEKWSYAGGISYGYSLPVGRRFNIDFTLGVGYLEGEYMEYDPIDGHYVWQSTKNRRWYGPTKAEVSLVWLIGKKNLK